MSVRQWEAIMIGLMALIGGIIALALHATLIEVLALTGFGALAGAALVEMTVHER